jgi:hypothetical protein
MGDLAASRKSIEFIKQKQERGGGWSRGEADIIGVTPYYDAPST